MVIQALAPRRTITGVSSALAPYQEKEQVFACRYSPDGGALALGTGNGMVEVASIDSGIVMAKHQGEKTPCTALAWVNAVDKRLLFCANAGGTLEEWDITRDVRVDLLRTPNNALHAIDAAPDGRSLAVAGKDRKVLIYDVANISAGPVSTLTMTAEHTAQRIDPAAHANRIFALKYPFAHRDILLSGGWDNTVQMWDLRMGCAVRHLSGPHMAGDSLDVFDNTIITGSYDRGVTLSLWDINSGGKIKDIPWTNVPVLSRLFTAKLNKLKQGAMCIAGGSDNGEARIFDTNTGEPIGRINCLGQCIFASHFNPRRNEVAVALSDGRVLICPLDPLTEKQEAD